MDAGEPRARRPRLTWVAGCGVGLSVAYPALIYFGRGHVPVSVLALVLVGLVWLRRNLAFGVRANGWLAGAGLLMAALALFADHALPLKLYPVAVNGLLLAIFGLSLRYPPPIVERLARLAYPELSPRAVRYIRRVTIAWCLFFAGNAGTALWTSLWASDRVWFYYNGVVAYALAGLMFLGEWLVRRRVLPDYRW
ncbi:MAG TPA: hypothetical protein VMG58_18375 [Candidatus Sulfotelmatobacter sp.]|nr:hypothetical protein [Candidatus Sulfotelmatobacter sp.]